MRRNNIRKTEALIMAFALSAILLLTGCGNSTSSKNTASNNASIVSSSNSVDNNNGSSGNKNTNGDSVNENNSTTDEAGVNHDYPVMLFSYDKNDTNYEEPEAFNSEHLGGNYGEIEKIEYYSPTTNATRNANVYLPYGYDKSKSYPVVYLLHGMSGTYEDYRVLGARPTAQNIVYEYNRNDMILVSFTVFTDVDGKQESDYGFSDLTARYDACENDVINALIPYINSHYSTKIGREYTGIAGYSLGGREALYLCFAHPDIFGYVGAFEPVGGVVNTGSGERLYGNRGYLLPELVKEGGEAPLLTLIVTGDEDPYCRVSLENYSRYMTEHSIDHIFYYRHGGHEAGVWNNGLYNFLRRIF